MEESNELLETIDELKKDMQKMLNQKKTDSQKNLTKEESSKKLGAIKKKVTTNKVHPHVPTEVKPLNPNLEFDLSKLRDELEKSHELFEATKDDLIGINFSNLSNRIKDLHLYPEEATLTKLIENRPLKESLKDLEDVMVAKLSEHPGEFGDIPELNTFFKACSRMKYGMEMLSEQNEQMRQLEKEVIQCIAEEDRQIVEFENQLKELSSKTKF